MRRIDLKRVNVARPTTIRDINRQIVLNYIRERGPISRAEIAQETALQRSTVSLIVDELKIGGLIEELSGESAAREALGETARFLGIGISNLIVGFSPEVVIVGGAITRAWDLVSDLFSETVRRSVRRDLPFTRIIPSTIGDRASLMGALSLVLADKFSSVVAV